MNDGFQWWLILVGAVITLAVIWVFAIRLPRAEWDVSDEERRAEAAWIGGTIERFGGIAPAELVEEVLELHAQYLASPGLARMPERSAPAQEVAPPSGASGAPEARANGPAPGSGAPPVSVTPGSPPIGPAPGSVSSATLPPPVRPPGTLGRADRQAPPTPPR